jgi:hypothetical protein
MSDLIRESIARLLILKSQSLNLRKEIDRQEAELIRSLRTPPKMELEKEILSIDGLECSVAAKEAASFIVESLPLSTTSYLNISLSEDDVSLYWNRYHYTCDIVEGEEQLYIMINVRKHTPDGKVVSDVKVLEGLIDSQCKEAISLLKEGFLASV